MKKFLASLMIAVTALSMVAEVAARPLGGGRSIGRQSPTVARQAPAPAAAPAPQRAAAAPAAVPPAAAPAPRPSMWKGVLGGTLLGLGIGALFSHFGMGAGLASALGSILMIALLAMAALFIYRMFRRNGNSAPAVAAATPYNAYNDNVAPLQKSATPDIGANLAQGASYAAPGAAVPMAPPPWGVPADFDTANFLRHAKASFIRMQAAWDKADTNDLREFTTPEVYAELKMQIQERGNVGDFTDVVSIDGELLGIETTASDYLASVRFTGMIRSAPTAVAEPFNEVWNMAKPLSGATGWVLAGIQQLPA
jgi:predicted lipid-binding transport protein (Tim44 family)